MRAILLAGACSALASCSFVRSFDHHDPRVRRNADGVMPEGGLTGQVELCETLCLLDASLAGVEKDHGDRPSPEVVRVDGQDGDRGFLASLDFPSLLSLPIGLLMEAGRWFVVEDADSFLGGLSFDNFLLFPRHDENQPRLYDPIQPGEEFEVRFRYLAIDNFHEGRLRDSWGGNGGEVSLQASLHALSPQGQLLRDDIDFLVTEEVKRRSPVLAALRATEKGREAVARIEERAREVLDQVDEYQQEIDGFIARVQGGSIEAREAGLRELRAALDRRVASVGDELLRSVARFAADELYQRAKDAAESPDIDAALAKFRDLSARLQQEVNLAAAFFDRYGVDEHGLYEQVEIIRGLADADHLTSIEFEGVRPSTFQIEAQPRNVGTAEILSMSPPETLRSFESRYEGPRGDEDADPGQRMRVAEEGLIYRGTLEQLTKLEGEARGFSLSVLMLERDSDKIAQALRYIEQYASDRDLEIGSSGIEASAVAEALAIVAEKIAEDDVELKCLDLRFSSAEPESGGAAGREIFQLRPCTVVIGRNVDLPEFGAVAVIDIRRLTPKG